MGLLEKLEKRERKKYAKLTKKEVAKLRKGDRIPKIEAKDLEKHEIKALKEEVKTAKNGIIPKGGVKTKTGSFLPTRVSKFDDLISSQGLERGSTILISGGAGTGKTTFSLQSIYNGALNGERGIYISLEEDVERLKEHMLRNYGWDFYKMEEEGKVAILKYDPIEIARSVEAAIMASKEKLEIEFKQFELPFKPDRVAVDSLSALSIAFGSTESYRKYIRHLFEKLEDYNSVNFILTETEQDPKIYSRAGIEEFLADGVIVLYNIQVHNVRENALEILKLRASKHEKRIVPFEITSNGIEIYPTQEIFREE